MNILKKLLKNYGTLSKMLDKHEVHGRDRHKIEVSIVKCIERRMGFVDLIRCKHQWEVAGEYPNFRVIRAQNA